MELIESILSFVLIDIQVGAWHILFFKALLLIALSPIVIGTVLAIVYIPLNYIRRFLKKRFNIDLYEVKYLSWFGEDFYNFMDEYIIFGMGWFLAGIFWMYWLIVEPIISIYKLFF